MSYTNNNGVFKNLLGILDANELQLAETAYVENRLFDLRIRNSPMGNFDLDHLKVIHHFLFQDVYEWAGKTRAEQTIIAGQSFMPLPVLIKGSSVFLLADQIKPVLEQAFEDLK